MCLTLILEHCQTLIYMETSWSHVDFLTGKTIQNVVIQFYKPELPRLWQFCPVFLGLSWYVSPFVLLNYET